MLEFAHQPIDCTLERARFLYDGKRAAHQKHKKDDRCSIGHPLWYRDDCIEWPDWIAFYGAVCPGNHNLTTGRCVFTPLILSRLNDPAADRSQRDEQDEQYERMREP